MGLPDWNDYLEVEPLKLTAEHFPLPCSLLEPVRERYTYLAMSAASEQAMSQEELRDYIGKIDNLQLPPLDAILAQTEAIGDPALPGIEQVAALRWLGVALQDWETNFPIEEPLASQIRRLKPLIAAVAVSSPDFLTPGAHPIHQILDIIQNAAVGWQPRLGRAGQALERQINKVVETALGWFEDGDTDLAEVCAELASAALRDLTRTRRMAQRVIETEQGRVKTAAAKRLAAQMINASLATFNAPPSIGEFLKGPWYASAQLVLLKYGADSEQWQQMSGTTHTLLDSLQTPDEASEERRQYIFETVTQLPKELKRWLLNLHHDSEAVDDAVGLVEFAHLRVLRQQPMEMEKIEPIPVESQQSDITDNYKIDALDQIETGQWLLLSDAEGPLRAQLVLKMEDEQQLLFTNQAGIKVLQLGYEDFVHLMAQGRVTALDHECSFSWSLANAAGLATVEALDEFTGAVAERARLEEEEKQRRKEEAERVVQERLEAQRLAQEKLEQERLEAERLEQEKLEQERLEAQRLETQRLEQQKIDEYRRQKQERQQRQAEEPTTLDPAHQMETASSEGGHSAEQVALNLPMGAWIGFHDGDTPLLAKLAVHDREQDQYFFVNRVGIKMRQISSGELLDLIERGLVDILETNSNFREEVSRIRNDSKE